MMLVNIYEAKRLFSELIRRVLSGETIMIANYNKPVAELRPIQQKLAKPRPWGLCAGKIHLHGNFNDPLPESLLQDFE